MKSSWPTASGASGVARPTAPVAPAAPLVMAAAPAPAAAPSAQASAAAPAAASGDPSKHPGAVKSPMVGTAYLAPEPGKPNFVSVSATRSPPDRRC